MRRKNNRRCFRKLKSAFWRFGERIIFLKKASSGASGKSHLYFMKVLLLQTANLAYTMLRRGRLKMLFCVTKPCADITYRVAQDGIPTAYQLKLRWKKRLG